MAVLSEAGIAVYEVDILGRPIPKPSLLWHSDLPEAFSPRHVAFKNDDIYVLTDIWDGTESQLWRSKGEELINLGPFVEAESISSLFSSIDDEFLMIQLQNGLLHHVNTEDDSTDLPPQTFLSQKLPAFCAEIQVVQLDNQVRISWRDICFS